MLGRRTSTSQDLATAKRGAACLPFFHPTRVAFIDDEVNFLNYFTRGLDLQVPISRYESPRMLLDELAFGRLPTRIDLDCWSNYRGQMLEDGYEQLMGLDKTMILMRLFNPQRFDVLSVAVVDYAMPEMDGIELCRRLSALPCRKILLTGQADESVAVDAFNEGLIDFFAPKDAPNVRHLIREQILRFQRDFISDASYLVRQALRSEHGQTWDDVGFCGLLEEIRERFGFVEYYAVSDPAEGFLLVDQHGRGRLLLTFSAAAIEAQFTAARLSGAPEEVLDRLAQEAVTTYFPSESGNQVLDAKAWRRACVPLTPFPNRSDRFYALLDHCEPFKVSPESVWGLKVRLGSQG